MQPLARAANPPRRLHVGTYAPQGEGIYSFTIGPDGELTPVGLTANPGSPSWLVADTTAQRVYAAEEGADHVAVYAADATGRLALLQRLPSGGHGPAQMSLGAGRLWVANYSDGRFAALAMQGDGRLGAAQSWLGCPEGACGPDASQATRRPPGSFALGGHEGPHAHMIEISPDGRWLLGTDLGRDRLLVWPLTAEIPMAPRHAVALPRGGGPRHFVCHPTQPGLVYVLQEQASLLATVAFSDDGARVLDEVSVLPEGFAGTSHASGLLLAPGGQHLYAFNRLHDSLAVVSLAQPRAPRVVDHHWVHGSFPRSACRVGRHLYVCNQRSDHLSHFDTSRPEAPRFTGRQTPVPTPAGACAL
ncbi:lactonase family protein [Roseateles cellulosilyticus]|uniref:Lactonase family protein n=1 Tax=Pelomonas cellulosilytica TaxID=2906762 RepID=A0ABS8XX68_9BURK|nr:beta-propeller fold lactonase family protein [Pelomonas sp. P8]MCE4557252.1 lactonase family protein [Pelomonas sp. P8]